MQNIAQFQDDGDISFPVITISVSTDDLSEPIHVDLGSIPPFIASAVLEKVISALKVTLPEPKVTFKGETLIAPPMSMIDDFFQEFLRDDDEDENP
jgi:hypothetical protein